MNGPWIRIGVVVAVVAVIVAAGDHGHPAATAGTDQVLADSADRAIELGRISTKLETVDRRRAVVVAQLNAAQVALADEDTKIGTTRAALAAVRARVRSRAVLVYRRGAGADQSLLEVGSVSDLNAAQRYAGAALDVDDTELASLTTREQTLDDERKSLADHVTELRQTNAELDATFEDLDRQRVQDQKLLDGAGAVPVLGDSWLSAAQLASWYRSTGAVPSLAPGTTIDDVARLYVVEGNAEHVRGDLAFAQAIIETGGFSVAAGNNYSGIGVCDSCSGGYSFPTPLDGVRAQIQLLRNYADPDSRASRLANPPSPGLYGADPVKAADLYDSFFLKGRAPLWNMMGSGNWATDPTYARKVIDLFASMVAFAVAHPQ